ncbi:MAG: hypothetical protein WAO51_08685, partial [Bacillota bacterium]
KLVNATGAEKILPETIIFRTVPLTLNVPIQQLVGMDGGVKTGKTTIVPRQFSLEGRIYYPDTEKIGQVFDALRSFLRRPPIEVYRLEQHDRFLLAHPQGAPHSWIDLGKELELSIPMIALDPYWHGPQTTVEVASAQVVEVDGNAPVSPLVRTTGSVAGLTIINRTNGNELVVTGTGVIEVDNADFTCRVNGENRLDAVNPEWLILGFSLLPGENQLETNQAIEIVYRPRWY